MSINIKFGKSEISKIIQSGGFFGSWLGTFGKKAETNIAIPLGRDNLPGLVSNLTTNAINKFKKNTWNRSCEFRKRISFYFG